MGRTIRLTADDGHELDAYVAEPENPATGAVVIIQEIFGVNSHIRAVTDDYARDGFVAIAPALFDRVERGIELGYDAEGRQRGVGLMRRIGIDDAVKDVAAAIHYGASVVGPNAVGVVGYCYGGSLAWLAATRLEPAAAVGYYGGLITNYLNERPRCPVMLHFGEKDAHIGPDKIAQIRTAYPKIPVFLYPAGHGFNCNDRGEYEPASAKLAKQRTLEFLRQHLDSRIAA
jgi:carboxymethylenebutenolidase